MDDDRGAALPTESWLYVDPKNSAACFRAWSLVIDGLELGQTVTLRPLSALEEFPEIDRSGGLVLMYRNPYFRRAKPGKAGEDRSQRAHDQGVNPQPAPQRKRGKRLRSKR